MPKPFTVPDELSGRDRNIVSIWQSLWVAYFSLAQGRVSDRHASTPELHIAWLAIVSMQEVAHWTRLQRRRLTPLLAVAN